ncbi:unnamed protein product [Mytilus coruscus]|uniref:Tudor domain-containing protein n=1 Tax=Mytilus coruscus TaxID=42192 RepID=A0A6J8BDQ3_MYTCO|nr:unnamed protein product [Mytilus coruscus]
MAYFKDDKAWYPARILAKKTLGYLVQYDDDQFIQTVPKKYLKSRLKNGQIECIFVFVYEPRKRDEEDDNINQTASRTIYYPLTNFKRQRCTSDVTSLHTSDWVEQRPRRFSARLQVPAKQMGNYRFPSSFRKQKDSTKTEDIFEIGSDVMAFFKDGLTWYPAKVLARKLTGYLIQYNDDRYMEIVPDKFLRLMEPSKDQTEKGASTTSEARQIKIHKGRKKKKSRTDVLNIKKKLSKLAQKYLPTLEMTSNGIQQRLLAENHLGI